MVDFRNFHQNRFPLWIFYVGGFALSFPFIYYTGGADSPVFMEMLGLLLIGGLVVRSRFKLKYALLLILFTYLSWEVFSATHDLSPYVPRSVLAVHSLHLAMLFAVLTLVILLARILGQSQKRMEQREQLLSQYSNAAHEMAQPLQVILMSSSLLQKMTEQNKLKPEVVVDFARKITEGAESTSQLLRQFRDESGRI